MSIQDALKQKAAEKALEYIQEDSIIGVGTGSTVNFLIDALAKHMKGKIKGAVVSSEATAKRLKAANIPVLDLNSVNDLPLYIDGADAYNHIKQLVKGGGGALTREKIIANAAKTFVCIVDESKSESILGHFPVPIEVIPMARSFVAREIVKLHGEPVYRDGFITDNGNIILDVHRWEIEQPIQLEIQLNQIVGTVCNGLFAARGADIILIGKQNGVAVLS